MNVEGGIGRWLFKIARSVGAVRGNWPTEPENGAAVLNALFAALPHASSRQLVALARLALFIEWKSLNNSQATGL